jgi:hypothetical protein
VVLALGPVGGPQPGGGFGFYPGLTSEDVDYKGVVEVGIFCTDVCVCCCVHFLDTLVR